MAKLGGTGRKLATVLAEAVGLDPANVLSVDAHIDCLDLATLTFKVVCTDEAGQVIVEDDDIKTEIRTWKETTGSLFDFAR